MNKKFNHEKLIVYKRSLDFVEFVEKILSEMKDRLNVYDQIDKSSTYIPLSIAEGTGKFSAKDKINIMISLVVQPLKALLVRM